MRSASGTRRVRARTRGGNFRCKGQEMTSKPERGITCEMESGAAVKAGRERNNAGIWEERAGQTGNSRLASSQQDAIPGDGGRYSPHGWLQRRLTARSKSSLGEQQNRLLRRSRGGRDSMAGL